MLRRCEQTHFMRMQRNSMFSDTFMQQKLRMQPDFRIVIRRYRLDLRKVLQSTVGPRPRMLLWVQRKIS